MKIKGVHINCDLGEGAKNEALIIPYVHSCSIACGGHYGSLESIISTLNLAKKHQVSVGAHPSYPDLKNFGRISLNMDKNAFIQSIRKQMDLFLFGLESVPFENFHVKAHGALYNDLGKNPQLCEWFLEALTPYSFSEIYSPWNSELYHQALKQHRGVKTEAFLDRNYTDQGNLVPRSHEEAEKKTLVSVWDQLVSIQEHQKVKTLSGKLMDLQAQTFCLHGDHPLALDRIQFLYQQWI